MLLRFPATPPRRAFRFVAMLPISLLHMLDVTRLPPVSPLYAVYLISRHFADVAAASSDSDIFLLLFDAPPTPRRFSPLLHHSIS